MYVCMYVYSYIIYAYIGLTLWPPAIGREMRRSLGEPPAKFKRGGCVYDRQTYTHTDIYNVYIWLTLTLSVCLNPPVTGPEMNFFLSRATCGKGVGENVYTHIGGIYAHICTYIYM